MKNKRYSNALMPWANAGDGTVTGVTPVGADGEGTPVVGWLAASIAAGQSGIAELAGVFALPKNAGESMTAGRAAYLMPSGAITATAEGNVYAGRVHADATVAEESVEVRINFGRVPA